MLSPDGNLRIRAYPSVFLPARSFSISAIKKKKKKAVLCMLIQNNHCPENKEHGQAADEFSKWTHSTWIYLFISLFISKISASRKPCCMLHIHHVKIYAKIKRINISISYYLFPRGK